MSELPELPPAPHLARPLPAGGLEAAIAGGRRRRHRALTAAGGGGTALALLVAAVLSVPDSGRRDSLQIAESPTPLPTATVPGPVVPTASPTASTSAPDDGASAAAAPAMAPSAGTRPSASSPARQSAAPAGLSPGSDASPVPRPRAGSQAPAPAGGGDVRPAYVEDTDEDAEGGCAVGAATGCTYQSGGRDVVRRGGQASVFLGVCVGADDIGERVYSFAGGQEKDVVVVREDDVSSEVFRFSSTVRYVQGAHERRARRGRCLQWTGRWDLVTSDGRPVPSGTYVVSLRVRADREVYENEPDPQPRGFDQTISTRITVVD